MNDAAVKFYILHERAKFNNHTGSKLLNINDLENVDTGEFYILL